MWWGLDAVGELRLASVFHETVWPRGRPLVADCHHRPLAFYLRRRRDTHPAPELRCECGIYALSTPSFSTIVEASFGFSSERLLTLKPVVFGRVLLWGTVVEHDRGWRASHAYPDELFLVCRRPNDIPTVRHLRDLERYGVPVTRVDAPSPGTAVERIEELAWVTL